MMEQNVSAGHVVPHAHGGRGTDKGKADNHANSRDDLKPLPNPLSRKASGTAITKVRKNSIAGGSFDVDDSEDSRMRFSRRVCVSDVCQMCVSCVICTVYTLYCSCLLVVVEVIIVTG